MKPFWTAECLLDVYRQQLYDVDKIYKPMNEANS